MRHALEIVRPRLFRLGLTAVAALLLSTMSMTAGAAGAMAQEAPAGAIVLVTNSNEDTLSVFDAGTIAELARILTGRHPHEVVASADGRLAFVTNYGTGEDPGRTLSVVDLMSRKEARRVALGPLLRPHGIDRSGSQVYFTTGGSRAVGRYDVEADAVDWIMGMADVSHLLVVTRDAGRGGRGQRGAAAVLLQAADVGAPGRAAAAIQASGDGRIAAGQCQLDVTDQMIRAENVRFTLETLQLDEVSREGPIARHA